MWGRVFFFFSSDNDFLVHVTFPFSSSSSVNIKLLNGRRANGRAGGHFDIPDEPSSKSIQTVVDCCLFLTECLYVVCVNASLKKKRYTRMQTRTQSVFPFSFAAAVGGRWWSHSSDDYHKVYVRAVVGPALFVVESVQTMMCSLAFPIQCRIP